MDVKEKPWVKYFKHSFSDYEGYVAMSQDVECLIRAFEIDTTTTFAVYKSKTKNFGATGNILDCILLFKTSVFIQVEIQ